MDLFSEHSADDTLPTAAQEVVEVLIPQPFNHGFDYRVPARFAGRVKRGDLVKVNFGPRKAEAKYVLGVVLGPGKGEVAIEKCKPIAQVFHDVPPLSETLLNTIAWVADYTMAPIGAVLKMVLPLADAVFDPPTYVRLSLTRHCEEAKPTRQSPSESADGDCRVANAPRNDGPSITPKRQKVISTLEWQANHAPPFANKTELAKAAGVSASIVSGMEKAGLLKASEEILAITHPSTNRNFSATSEDSSPRPSVGAAVSSIAQRSSAEQGKSQTQLSASQEEAATVLCGKLHQGFSVTLMDGVTGSGKTEVYFEVIEALLKGLGIRDWGLEAAFCEQSEAIHTNETKEWTAASRERSSQKETKRGQQAEPFSARPVGGEANRLGSPHPLGHKLCAVVRSGSSQKKETSASQALVLLPEIALSHQWLKRCEARFGFSPVVWHSGMTKRQRAIALRSIMTGSARLIVGARSALFLPYRNLGLVIVDEEHDGSYKQEEGVMYHARDMAVARAHQEAIPLVLASATPSVETVVNVQRGRYGRVVLESRYGGAQLPQIDMIDMRSEPLERGRWVSPKLREALLSTLAKGHQSLLFLNRRGYAPLVLCRSCGTRAECPNCSTWMVLHAASRPYLQCHHCDTRLPVPKSCHSCGETDGLTPCGPGVERIAEEVMQTIPQARIGILSSDHAEQGESLQELLAKVENRAIDIIIGTQIIAKGHHFPYLATVGVVDADLGLSGGDLRASERSYQLLHQLAGRAGREHTGGQVYLQSYMPEHPVMQALAAGNRDGLLALEMQQREAMQMPPYGRLAAIILESKNETEVRNYAAHLAAHAPHLDGITILGPAPAPLLKLRRYFRYRFLIQAPLNVHLQKLIESWLTPHPIPRGMKRKVDIDPYSFL